MKENNETPHSMTISSCKEEILKNLDQPRKLEALYLKDRSDFKRSFNLLYADIQNNTTAQIWNERLNYKQEESSKNNRNEIIYLIVACFIAGFIAKIPELIGMSEEVFYTRNIGFIVFPIIALYFVWKNEVHVNQILIIFSAFLCTVIYINFLPKDSNSDTLTLACIHLPLILWSVVGFSFVGNNVNSYNKRLDFLRFNGDLIVMAGLLFIACAALTAVTFGLFGLIDLNIEYIFSKYLAVWGVPAIPIIATYLVWNNPQLVNRVSPIVARIFTPLVLVVLIAYLIAVIYSGKSPYNDREFLMIFNVLLFGVMAIILFSVAEISKNSKSRVGIVLLLALASTTGIVNSIALSAIIFRISEWGITPNRLAVVGANILILINLLLVTFRLFKSLKHRKEIENVEKSIAIFLPVYILWAILVTFIFPLLFGFK